MESLNLEVQLIFDNKDKYRDIDYILIMSQLKEKYLKLVQPIEKEIDIAEQIAEDNDIEYDSDGYENYFSSY